MGIIDKAHLTKSGFCGRVETRKLRHTGFDTRTLQYPLEQSLLEEHDDPDDFLAVGHPPLHLAAAAAALSHPVLHCNDKGRTKIGEGCESLKKE